jgi:hypothetical protein
MQSTHKFAIYYMDKLGFSVIPIGIDKKPLVPWLEFQKGKATYKDLSTWFEEGDAMVGIVTGEISNVCVIDVDTPDGEKRLRAISPESFNAPTVLTPRGGRHLYFEHEPGMRNLAGAIPGTDFRGEGGYVVAPPSFGINGKQYAWATPLHSILIAPGLGPLQQNYIKAVKSPVVSNRATVGDMFSEGRRDTDLFHVAHTMIRGGASRDEAAAAVMMVAQKCKPPFPAAEAMAKVQSAVERAMRKERNISKEIEDLVRITRGYFTITDIIQSLQLITKEERNNTRVILHRLVESGLIERESRREGVYRRVERDLVPMTFSATTIPPMSLNMPFGLHTLVDTYPGNVIVVAGSPNAGKTAFCLDFVEKNQDDYTIHYFNSEMGDEELKNRLMMHRDKPMNEWKFNAYERSDHFADVICPNDINIIDFLEITTEFYRIGEEISAIHKKLMGNKGIAIVCIQKAFGTDMGRGGTFSMEKPRLYLAMDGGKVKIVKGKNWADPMRNPNGLCKFFKLVGGAEFIETSDWHIIIEEKK